MTPHQQLARVNAEIKAHEEHQMVQKVNALLDIIREAGIDPKTMPKTKLRAPRYSNVETGETWSGVGRSPLWVWTEKARTLFIAE